MSSKSDDVIDQFLGTTSGLDKDFDRAVSTYARAGSKVWDDLMNPPRVEQREAGRAKEVEGERAPERGPERAGVPIERREPERQRERFRERE